MTAPRTKYGSWVHKNRASLAIAGGSLFLVSIFGAAFSEEFDQNQALLNQPAPTQPTRTIYKPAPPPPEKTVTVQIPQTESCARAGVLASELADAMAQYDKELVPYDRALREGTRAMATHDQSLINDATGRMQQSRSRSTGAAQKIVQVQGELVEINKDCAAGR